MRNLVLATAAAAALVIAQPASADTVSDWMEFAYRLGAAQETAPGPRLPDYERATTRTAVAMFEALNAIDRRYKTYLGLAIADSSASQDAAASTAAFKVLHHHYPAQRTALEQSYALAMATIADQQAREAGRLIGEAAAAAAIAAGGIDPSIEQEPYRPRTRPGEWVGASLPSLDPYRLAFRPWIIPTASALLPLPPVPLNSDRYARDYEEVRRLGSRASTERTTQQTLVAFYRLPFDTMPAPRQIAEAQG